MAPSLIRPLLLALIFLATALGGCKTVPPGEDLYYVLISKESDEEIQVQVIFPEETKVAILPVVGDELYRWQLLTPRVTASREEAEKIAAGVMAFQLKGTATSHTEKFVPK